MNALLKYRIMTFLCFLFMFFLIYNALHYFFTDLKDVYITMISGASTAILAPRVKKIKTEVGIENHLTWIFLKTPIRINEN